MSNYSAVVVRLKGIHPHSNADRLNCVNIYGNNVIIGKDTKEGAIGLFFPVESQLGKDFAEVNDLIRRKDENGKPAGGMFDDNRRVRAQTLRGEKSMGFWCPLDFLLNLEGIDDISDLYEGQELETYRGYEISKKYVVPAKTQGQPGSKQGRKSKKESRIIPEQFHFHFDTAQLGRNLNKISPNDLISISWKTHGTSGICGNVLVKKKLKWYEKALKAAGVNIVDSEYDYVFSSRRVIKNDDKEYNHFYSTDIWSLAGEQFRDKLHKGETCYFEILGFLPDGGAIQKGYDYGCAEGEHKIQIYRITQTNADGIVTELPWHQMIHRAKELSIDTVPEIYYGKAYDLDTLELSTHEEYFGESLLDYLKSQYVHDQDCQFCKNKVPAEGVVIRVERGDGIENFKLKSERFYLAETKQLDSGEVDLESGES